MSDSVGDVMQALDRGSFRPADYSAPFVRLFPVSGASVSTLGDVLGSETLSASDDRAARLDEWQMDLGEGPCWDALRSMAPVEEPSFATAGHTRWPAFSAASSAESVASIFAFPLAVGPLRLGAVDLYSLMPVALTKRHTGEASAIADAIGRDILTRAIGEQGDLSSTSPASRRVVHQATGMVLAQLQVGPDAALLAIQGHAFASGRAVADIAEDIVQRRLRFVNHDGRIEVEQ